MRGKGGECRDLTKRIFVHNSVPSEASPPWIQDEDIYTCLNHAPRDESPLTMELSDGDMPPMSNEKHTQRDRHVPVRWSDLLERPA